MLARFASPPQMPHDKSNPVSVYMAGIGSKGGEARATRLNQQQRSLIASKAGKASWASPKRKKPAKPKETPAPPPIGQAGESENSG